MKITASTTIPGYGSQVTVRLRRFESKRTILPSESAEWGRWLAAAKLLKQDDSTILGDLSSVDLMGTEAQLTFRLKGSSDVS